MQEPLFLELGISSRANVNSQALRLARALSIHCRSADRQWSWPCTHTKDIAWVAGDGLRRRAWVAMCHHEVFSLLPACASQSSEHKGCRCKPLPAWWPVYHAATGAVRGCRCAWYGIACISLHVNYQLSCVRSLLPSSSLPRVPQNLAEHSRCTITDSKHISLSTHTACVFLQSSCRLMA